LVPVSVAKRHRRIAASGERASDVQHLRVAAFLLPCSSMKTRMLSLFAAALFATGAAGCHRHGKPSEGPAERAGKKIDHAAEKTKDATKDAAHDTKEGAKDIKNDVKRDVK
jgi:hypothetical protein